MHCLAYTLRILMTVAVVRGGGRECLWTLRNETVIIIDLFRTMAARETVKKS